MMSRKQWIGLAMLLLIVASFEVSIWLIDRRMAEQNTPALLTLQPEREEAFLLYLDSVSEAEDAARRAQYAHRYQRPTIVPQPFDPNTADSALLVTVGLKPYMAKNLIRYRQAGKIFHRPDDLRRLYGMTDSLYSTLEPFIRIDTTFTDTLPRFYRGLTEVSPNFDSLPRPFYLPKRDTILDLNTADTAELCLLRGVGRFTAVQIIRYRQALGGYYSPAQLYEIADYFHLSSQLPKERIDSIQPFVFADTTRITPIDINSASVRRLQKHPYISYTQAEQLYNLRRTRIALRSMKEVQTMTQPPLFTPDEQRRLTPYIRFNAKQ